MHPDSAEDIVIPIRNIDALLRLTKGIRDDHDRTHTCFSGTIKNRIEIFIELSICEVAMGINHGLGHGSTLLL
jgi:hypothetical protein